MLRVQVLALREELVVGVDLRAERRDERVRLVDLEAHELQLLLGDLDLVAELFGLGLRGVGLPLQILDHGVGVVDGGLELIRGLPVALGIRA